MMRAALLMAFISWLLMISSSWDDAPCLDEPEHVTAGVCYVYTGQFWMNPYHPPLVKALSGLALSPWSWQIPWQHFADRHKEAAIDDFFYHGGNDPQKIIRIARFPLICFSAAFIVFYFWLLREQLGQRAALLATFLLALSPNFLAHARLVTTDAAAAGMAFVCLSLWARHLHQPRRASLTLVGLATGVALLVKYSMVVLLPFYWLRRNPIREGLVVLLLALGVVWLIYAAVPVPAEYQVRYNTRAKVFADQSEPVFCLIRATESLPGLRHLSWYATGFYAQTRHLKKGHDKPSYLKRTYYQGGRWDYFPTLLLCKEPLAFLILVGVALTVGWRRREPPVAVIVYSGFAGLYLGIAMLAQLNIGIRHVLPLLPPVYALTAWALVGDTQPLSKPRRILLIVCALWGFLAVLQAWPGYLSYFNELAGGKQAGPQIALDSNFDWGQDLYRLRLYCQRNQCQRLYLIYSGRNDPNSYLGSIYRPFPSTQLPAGELLGVSAHFRMGLERTDIPENIQEWIASLEEVDRVGDTILILKAR